MIDSAHEANIASTSFIADASAYPHTVISAFMGGVSSFEAMGLSVLAFVTSPIGIGIIVGGVLIIAGVSYGGYRLYKRQQKKKNHYIETSSSNPAKSFSKLFKRHPKQISIVDPEIYQADQIFNFESTP